MSRGSGQAGRRFASEARAVMIRLFFRMVATRHLGGLVSW